MKRSLKPQIVKERIPHFTYIIYNVWDKIKKSWTQKSASNVVPELMEGIRLFQFFGKSNIRIIDFMENEDKLIAGGSSLKYGTLARDKDRFYLEKIFHLGKPTVALSVTITDMEFISYFETNPETKRIYKRYAVVINKFFYIKQLFKKTIIDRGNEVTIYQAVVSYSKYEAQSSINDVNFFVSKPWRGDI